MLQVSGRYNSKREERRRRRSNSGGNGDGVGVHTSTSSLKTGRGYFLQPDDLGSYGGDPELEDKKLVAEQVREQSPLSLAREVRHAYKCSLCRAEYSWTRRDPKDGIDEDGEDGIVYLRVKRRIKIGSGLPKLNPLSKDWIRNLDPESWGLTEDEELKHVLWCPDLKCSTRARWNRLLQVLLPLVDKHCSNKISLEDSRRRSDEFKLWLKSQRGNRENYSSFIQGRYRFVQAAYKKV